jgi:hypothetical protein
MSLIKQENNKFKGFEGHRETMFFKISYLEYILILGVIATVVLGILVSIPVEIQPVLIIAGMMILLQYLRYFCSRLYRRIKRQDYLSWEIASYEGSLDEMTFALYKVGLNLKKKIGEYYIFTTNYITLSNSEFVVREGREFCSIQSHPAVMKELKRYIKLVSLKNESIKKLDK